MLRSPYLRPATVLTLALMLLGSATASSDKKLNNTVYAIHRAVQNLTQNLQEAVNNLNENTAQLSARVEGGERQARLLQGKIEENQIRLEQLQQTIDDLTVTLYRHFNLSPPTRVQRRPVFTPGPRVDPAPLNSDIVVEPPDELSPSDPFRSRTQFQPPVQRSQPQREARLTSPMDDYDACRKQYEDGNYELAVEMFEDFLKRHGTTDLAGNAQYWKSYCYIKLENFDRAIKEFQLLRANYPDSNKIPAAMHNEAVAYVKLGQNARAEEMFRKLIEQYPMDAAAELAKEKLGQLQGR